MKHNKLGTLKPLAVAIGLGLAVASSPASALISWGSPLTLFEDDNVDFLVKGEGNTATTTIEVGDVLIAVAKVQSANGVAIAPEELTAVGVIQLMSFADLDGAGGLNDMVFGPTGDFNSFAGTSLGAGINSSAMVAFWNDPTPNLNIGAGSIISGTASCSTLAGCLAQATDGALWQVDGMDGTDADDYWVALNAQTDTTIVDSALGTQAFGSVNAGLSILFNGTGQNLAEGTLACGAFCSPGGDGFVDFSAQGSILGGMESSFTSEWFATSDFDFLKATEVPEPGTLALMAMGLLGFGASLRRRRRS